MIRARVGSAIRALHWTVGLVVLLASYRSLHAAYLGIHTQGRSEALARVRLALSGSELVAAILFLIPFTVMFGAYALLGIFAAAILFHTLHRDFVGLEILVLYAVAVYLSLAAWKDKKLENQQKEGGELRMAQDS